MSVGVRVSMSSGDVFWVDADAEDLRKVLDADGLVWVGGRMVNPQQVAMLTYEQVPSIESPERLKEAV